MKVRAGIITIANNELNNILVSLGYKPLSIDYRTINDGYKLFIASYYKTSLELYNELTTLASNGKYLMIRIRGGNDDKSKRELIQRIQHEDDEMIGRSWS